MKSEIDELRKSVRRLQMIVGLLVIVAGVTSLSAFTKSDDVIRTHGIVILDASGRERILIGAPIPNAKNRVRTDIARVEKFWGSRFPREYITKYYPTYRNGMNGMLVLDEQGIDRVAVGDSVPDPNIGKRVGPSSGIVINDSEGFERTGYGLLRVDTSYRVSLGLDSDGGEAISLFVDDETGLRGIQVAGDSSSIFMGHASKGFAPFGLATGFHGIQIDQGRDRRILAARQ